MFRSMVVTTAALALAGGCSGGGGNNVVLPPDAVTGHAQHLYRLETKELAQPDPDLMTYQLLAPLADGGFVTHPVARGEDGGFSIAAAPSGEYYLKLDNYYVVTSARSVDLDRYRLGRPNRTADFPDLLSLSFTLTGLRANTTNGFDIVTPNIDLWGSLYLANTPAGSSVVNATGWGYGSSAINTLPDGADEDHTWISQLEDCAPPDAGLYTYCNAYGPGSQLTALKLLADGSSTLTATLSAGASMPVNATFSPASHLAHTTELHPQAVADLAYVSVYPSPGAPGLPPKWIGYSGSMFDVSLSPLSEDLPLSFGYSDPYPIDWVRIAAWGYYFETPTLLPGTTTGRLSASIQDTRPLSAMPATLTARLSPPRKLTVDGQPASAAADLARTTPLIAWEAPAMGTVSGYAGSIYSLTATGESTVRTLALSFTTTGTSFQVPPGELALGGNYVVRVTAIYGPDLDLATAPLGPTTAIDLSLANTVSGVLHVP